VSELHKMRLFIYIPWTKSGLLTLFTYTRTGLFAQRITCFPFMVYLISGIGRLSGAAQRYGVRDRSYGGFACEVGEETLQCECSVGGGGESCVCMCVCVNSSFFLSCPHAYPAHTHPNTHAHYRSPAPTPSSPRYAPAPP
jgi:hypothetical protein